MIETPMVRTLWTDKPMFEDVTVVICQNKTYDLIRLSVESLLTFYPTIKILVVNGSPSDASGRWLKFKEKLIPNLTVWDRTGYDSHGVAMHEAIMTQVQTKYMVMMDSDVIMKRHGVMELMREAFDKPAINGEGPVWATGSLMNVTRSNHACGAPKDENDVLRYIHPSCGMIDLDVYRSMESRFTDHGAPCVYPMIEGEKKGLRVVGLPVADYVMHLSGASWTDPRTVWEKDFGVHLRPVVTFVTNDNVKQDYNDYDIIRPGARYSGNVVVHGRLPQMVDNMHFSTRFNVQGEYVCVGDNPPPNVVSVVMGGAGPEIINVGNRMVYRRDYYQSKISFE